MPVRFGLHGQRSAEVVVGSAGERLDGGFQLLRFYQGRGIISGSRKLVIPLSHCLEIGAPSCRSRRARRKQCKKRHDRVPATSRHAGSSSRQNGHGNAFLSQRYPNFSKLARLNCRKIHRHSVPVAWPYRGCRC
jgi:hypothetical protein